MPPARLTPSPTPHGRVVLTASDEAPELEPALAQRLLDAFERGSGPGLLQLGGAAAFIAKALGDIARAKGMAHVAHDAGLSRESLCKALS